MTPVGVSLMIVLTSPTRLISYRTAELRSTWLCTTVLPHVNPIKKKSRLILVSSTPTPSHDKETPSDFRLDHQLVTAGGCIPPPSRFLADRDHKKYWCEPCEIGFSQKQGFTRHNKDKHLQRDLCTYCRNLSGRQDAATN